MKPNSIVVILALPLLGGCYGSDFTPTAPNFSPTPRSEANVRIVTGRPGSEYVEVGLLTASGASYEGALARVKEEAATQGCEVVLVLGESLQSGAGTPGSAYGMTKSNLRASCFVAASTGPAASAKQTASVACAPACRDGFSCVAGGCVSACNPVCTSGESCVGHGAEATCVSRSAAAAAPLAP